MSNPQIPADSDPACDIPQGDARPAPEHDHAYDEYWVCRVCGKTPSGIDREATPPAAPPEGQEPQQPCGHDAALRWYRTTETGVITNHEFCVGCAWLASLRHRCSGCGHRWNADLKGAELCGDCWRKAQRVVHEVAASGSQGEPPSRYAGLVTLPDAAAIPARAEGQEPPDRLPYHERMHRLAVWVRTPGNINRDDAIDECARLLENNAAAWKKEALSSPAPARAATPPETEKKDDSGLLR